MPYKRKTPGTTPKPAKATRQPKKKVETTPKPKRTNQGKKSKPPTAKLPNVKCFWKPICYGTFLHYSPYHVTEDCFKKIFSVCTHLAEKFERGYKWTLYGRIDYFIRRLAMSPIKKRQDMQIIDKLIKLAIQEIMVIFDVLQKIQLILSEQECSEVNENIAEREGVLRPVQTLYLPMLLELSSLIPVWMGSINEIAPPMVGAIPAHPKYVIEPGQLVAAFVLTTTSEKRSKEVVEKGENRSDFTIFIPPAYEEFGIVGSWLLARVLKHVKPIYIIGDIDSSSAFPHYEVGRKRIIPLPLYRADPRTNPEAIFPVGSVVLGLDKNTTCFFPAVVLDTPKSLSDTYSLLFRDSSNKLLFGAIHNVPQRYVIKYVEAIKIFTPNQRKVLNANISDISG